MMGFLSGGHYSFLWNFWRFLIINRLICFTLRDVILVSKSPIRILNVHYALGVA